MNQFRMPKAEEKAEFVKDNFATIAAKYDLFNDISTFFMHRYWKRKMVSLIKSKDIQKPVCLDLCCGTGDISLLLLKHLKDSVVYSVDFSEKMLEIANIRLRDYGSNQIQVGDATNLEGFGVSSMDVVTVGFGLRNVNSIENAISEIYRVLKEGGIFVNLDVGKVSIPVIKWFADFYFFKVVPLLGHVVSGRKNNMFNYLPVSSLYYPDQKGLKNLLENQGFQDVGYKNFVFGNTTMHWGIK